MQNNQIVLISIIIIPVIFVILGKVRMDVAALFMAVVLGVLQYVGFGILGTTGKPEEAIKAIAGFGQPVIITLIALFIISRSLEKSGVTRALAEIIIRFGKNDTRRMIALFTALSALLSLFMNNVAAGALVLPCALDAAARTKIKPSKLLIPVSFGSLLGGTATYFTTANIIMSDLLQVAQPPQVGLHILSFTAVGGLMVISGIVFLFFFGNKLLPDREPGQAATFFQISPHELRKEYQLTNRLWEIRVKPNIETVFDLRSISDIDSETRLTFIAHQKNDHDFIYQNDEWKIRRGEVIWAIGDEKSALLIKRHGLQVNRLADSQQLNKFGIYFSEMMLAPHSRLKGLTLKEAKFRNLFNVNVLAVKRGKRIFHSNLADFPLSFGDLLLVSGEKCKVEGVMQNSDLINFQASNTDQQIDLKVMLPAVTITLGAVAASIAGVPIALSMLVGAVLMFITKTIPIDEAYHSIEWQVIFLIAGMYPVSQAIVQTGLADLFGNTLLSFVSPFGGLGLAAGSFLATSLLTQIIGGQVTALVTGPVTISAAISMGVNPQAIAVATAIGCSASFLTPFAHPVNMIMMAPGNYRFTDFWKVGWPLTIISFVMLLIGMKLFWGL